MHQQASDIGRALRNWRIQGRLQQSAIAECLGVTQSQVSRWESGRDLPRPHNVEAIRRLIWGPDAEPLQGLRHFVEQSSQHLLLIDMHHTIIARSRTLRSGSELFDRFGWVLDPDRNPAFAPVWQRFVAILKQPSGTVGLTVTLPFMQQDEYWCATLAMIVYSVAGERLCLAEPHFARCDALGDIRFEEVRIAADQTQRQTLTLWQQARP
ncbi:helix-turn-helix transcriptional regulator [Devosia sp. YIM 151766]|uniref:helix-turn-helix domain-containing protein n=1 Tax=Devosia sp. YIM 151766 TaxID=3017325 RepID=UPI00255C9132|nr:helix-turn-helix transcriptional regulator [Devosia sp. YIM 151766]WIY51762.1 helix-turn-helix transcriptional regulator [Devosia sp. YIM 151766]